MISSFLTERVLQKHECSSLQFLAVDLLVGDPSKAKTKLCWAATTTLDEMICEVVASDLDRMVKEASRKVRHG